MNGENLSNNNVDNLTPNDWQRMGEDMVRRDKKRRDDAAQQQLLDFVEQGKTDAERAERTAMAMKAIDKFEKHDQKTDWGAGAGEYQNLEARLGDMEMREPSTGAGKIAGETAADTQSRESAPVEEWDQFGGRQSEDDNRYYEHWQNVDQPKDDFAGEQNINSATGKTRSNAAFDYYPHEKGESNPEYSDRWAFMRDAKANPNFFSPREPGESGEDYAKRQQEEIQRMRENASTEIANEAVPEESSEATQVEEGSAEVDAGDHSQEAGAQTNESEDVNAEDWPKVGAEMVEQEKKRRDDAFQEKLLNMVDLYEQTGGKQGLTHEQAMRFIDRYANREEKVDWDAMAEDWQNLEARLGDMEGQNPSTGVGAELDHEGEDTQAEQAEQDQASQEEADARAFEDAQARQYEQDQARQYEQDQAKQYEQEQAAQYEREAAEDLERRAALLAEKEELEKEEREIIKKELEKLTSGSTVLANADFTYDAREMAYDEAQKDLNTEMETANFAKRIWKGSLFKKYYELKYAKAYLTGERKRDGQTLEDIIQNTRKSAVIGAMVEAATLDDDRFMHLEAGGSFEKMDIDTREKLRGAIMEFASAEIGGGRTLDDLRREFANSVDEIQAEARAAGEPMNGILANNYLEVAIQTRENAEHYIGLRRALDGMDAEITRGEAANAVLGNLVAYNADVRSGERTEAHRGKLLNLVNRVESSKVGRFIPGEVIAGAAGVASALVNTGARAVGGAVAGLGASTIIAGAREANRVTEDRARAMRDRASGMEYPGAMMSPAELDRESIPNRRLRKTRQYEAKIGDTLYKTKEASELIDGLRKAREMEPGEARDKAYLEALMAARVRSDFSDAERKDLIAYTSAAERGNERLALDREMIYAERDLSSRVGAKAMESARNMVLQAVEQDVDQKDAEFKRVRAAQVSKKMLKTLGTGIGAMLVSQEVQALLSPNKAGAVEQLVGRGGTNNAGASKTILANMFGVETPSAAAGAEILTRTETVTVRSDETARMEELRAQGYEMTSSTPDTTTIVQGEIQEVTPAESSLAVKPSLKYANNGTSVSDGNELRLHIRDGKFLSTMRGTSTIGGGEVLDYDALAESGQIRGLLKIGGTEFIVEPSVNDAGQLVFGGENGIFELEGGGTIRVFGNNGEKLFDRFWVVADRGTSDDGVRNLVSFASTGGKGTFSGVMQEMTGTPVTIPGESVFSRVVEVAPTAPAVAPTVSAAEQAATYMGGGVAGGVAATMASARTRLSTPVAKPRPVRANPTPVAAPARATTPVPQTIVAHEIRRAQRPGATPAGEGQASAPGAEKTPDQMTRDRLEASKQTEEAREAERASRIRRIADLIRANSSLYGADGVAILTDMEGYSEANDQKYSAWWNGLSEDARSNVRLMMESLNMGNDEEELPLGSGFNAWLKAGKDAETGEAVV